jgi:DNA replication protein DnaC
MLNHPTVEKLHQLRLSGMARALASQAQTPDIGQLSFDERLGLLVDSEAADRESRQNAARLKRARLKQAATPEDVDYRHPRGLDRALFARLMTGRWVGEHQNVLLCGPTGIGKTFLACALANQACRQGHSVLYVRLTRLLPTLAIGRGDGSWNAYEITSRFDCALGHATCLLGCSENSKGNAAWAITGKT